MILDLTLSIRKDKKIFEGLQFFEKIFLQEQKFFSQISADMFFGLIGFRLSVFC